MRCFQKKKSLMKERYYPYVYTSLICLFLYYHQSNDIVMEIYQSICSDVFLTAMLSVFSIIFGFLLSTIALLLQSKSKPIEEMQKAGRLPELVKYNSDAVKSVFLSTVLTSILLLTYKVENIPYYDCLVSAWVAITILSTLFSHRFLKLFYILA